MPCMCVTEYLGYVIIKKTANLDKDPVVELLTWAQVISCGDMVKKTPIILICIWIKGFHRLLNAK